MHYLFVLAVHEWSGSARSFTAAARGLVARGHTVTIVVQPESIVEQVVSQAAVTEGDSLFRIEPLSLRGVWLVAAWQLRVLVRQRRIDIVFVHTNREHLVAAAACCMGARFYIVRRIPTEHTANIHWSGRLASWLAPTSLMFASEADLRATAVPGRAKESVVVPLGVPFPPPSLPLVEQGEDAGTYIVCVHDASSRAQAATAIRTVAMLAPLHHDLQLVVIGESQYDDDLRMQAAALGVLPRINFLGERADEIHLMRGARLGWVVAGADTAAYAILDLMALGVPVLGKEGTVAERYVLPRITGVLLPPDDPYLTASTVAGLLSSNEQCSMMGDAARLRVAREFSEQAMIDGFERSAVLLRQNRPHVTKRTTL